MLAPRRGRGGALATHSQIVRQPGQHHAVERGVARCGSIWGCPVCAPQIAGARGADLDAFVHAHQLRGGAVLMATLTFSHKHGQPLGSLLDGMIGAWQDVISRQPWRKLRARLGYVGAVRATEPTYGANGWHPHLHVLLFFDGAIDEDTLDEIGGVLGGEWTRACVARGLGRPSAKHGVDVRRGFGAIADYLAKWGAGRELAWGHCKRGKRGSVTPWDLLRAARLGDDQAAELWREYIHCFKGRHQMEWSPALRRRFGASAPGADAVDAVEQGPAELLATVSWQSTVAGDDIGITSDRSVIGMAGLRVNMLEAAEQRGQAGVDHVIRLAWSRTTTWDLLAVQLRVEAADERRERRYQRRMEIAREKARKRRASMTWAEQMAEVRRDAERARALAWARAAPARERYVAARALPAQPGLAAMAEIMDSIAMLARGVSQGTSGLFTTGACGK